jgi:TrmH family RNA methyltransferase
MKNIVVVLTEPQDLVNIAGTARAMLNMGLERLRLVKPAEFDAYRITGIAHGSDKLVEQAEFFDTLGEAIADAGHIVGTSARRRSATFVWQHPREAAPDILELATGERPVALVFGRERTGLTNEELDLCDRILTIPTSPTHSSMNLAQAVLLVSYELWLASQAHELSLPRARRSTHPASADQLQALFEDSERALDSIDFFKARNAPMIMRTVRALVRRARPDAREAKLLRAMAIEVRKVFARRSAQSAHEPAEPSRRDEEAS